MVNNSLKPFREVIMDVITLPSRLAVENYVNVVERMNYGALFMNNVIITVVGLLGIIVFSSIAAYTINRTRNRYTDRPFSNHNSHADSFSNFHDHALEDNERRCLAESGGTGHSVLGLWGPHGYLHLRQLHPDGPEEIDGAFIDGASTLQTFVHVILSTNPSPLRSLC